MGLTQISDLWVPVKWAKEIREKMATFPRLWNSGILVNSPLFDERAKGEGTSVTMPFIKDSTDVADEIQVENSAPSINGVTGDLLVAPCLNRVSGWAATALSKQVSGADPAAEITATMATRRLKQRQTTLLSVVRGVMGSANTGAANGVLAAQVMDRFDESGLDLSADQIFSVDMFIDGCALLGELEDDLAVGGIWIHPNVKASLKKADNNNWDTVSKGAFTITTYRGIPIYTSSALVRNGTTNGYVYETYLFAPGTVGYGEKPQAGDTIDAASLSLDPDKGKNNWEIYDRTRFLLLVDGTKWVGSPAGQSATNAELATVGNWQYKFQTVNRCGMVCIRTNG